MQQTIALGPFIMNLGLLLIIISAIAGYFALKLYLRRTGLPQAQMLLDQLSSIAIGSFFIWKFSPLLLDSANVINNPMSLLYFSGGTTGVLLAGVFVVGMLIFKSRRSGKPLYLYIDAAFIWFVALEGVYRLLQALFLSDAEVFNCLGTTLLAAVILMIHMRKKTKPGDRLALAHMVMWYSIGRLFLTLIDNQTGSSLFGFSVGQLVLIITACLSFVIKMMEEKSNHIK